MPRKRVLFSLLIVAKLATFQVLQSAEPEPTFADKLSRLKEEQSQILEKQKLVINEGFQARKEFVEAKLPFSQSRKSLSAAVDSFEKKMLTSEALIKEISAYQAAEQAHTTALEKVWRNYSAEYRVFSELQANRWAVKDLYDAESRRLRDAERADHENNSGRIFQLEDELNVVNDRVRNISEKVIGLLDSADANVQCIALELIIALGDAATPFKPKVETLIESEDAKVSAAARKALDAINMAEAKAKARANVLKSLFSPPE